MTLILTLHSDTLKKSDDDAEDESETDETPAEKENANSVRRNKTGNTKQTNQTKNNKQRKTNNKQTKTKRNLHMPTSIPPYIRHLNKFNLIKFKSLNDFFLRNYFRGSPLWGFGVPKIISEKEVIQCFELN